MMYNLISPTEVSLANLKINTNCLGGSTTKFLQVGSEFLRVGIYSLTLVNVRQSFRQSMLLICKSFSFPLRQSEEMLIGSMFGADILFRAKKEI